MKQKHLISHSYHILTFLFLCFFVLCRFKNSFKSGFNTSINAMAAQAIQNASQYFPKEGVQALGELAALVAGMFDKAVDARGKKTGREQRHEREVGDKGGKIEGGRGARSLKVIRRWQGRG